MFNGGTSGGGRPAFFAIKSRGAQIYRIRPAPLGDNTGVSATAPAAQFASARSAGRRRRRRRDASQVETCIQTKFMLLFPPPNSAASLASPAAAAAAASRARPESRPSSEWLRIIVLEDPRLKCVGARARTKQSERLDLTPSRPAEPRQVSSPSLSGFWLQRAASRGARRGWRRRRFG